MKGDLILFVIFIVLLLIFEYHWCEYGYPFFASIYRSAKLFPFTERRYKACIGLLEHDKNTIAYGIVCKFTHIPQAFLVSLRLEYSLNAVINFLEQILHFLTLLCLVFRPLLWCEFLFPSRIIDLPC